MNRELYSTLPNGLKLYKAKLVGGPYDQFVSLASHDTVYHKGERYTRRDDDLYYYDPEPKTVCPNDRGQRSGAHSRNSNAKDKFNG